MVENAKLSCVKKKDADISLFLGGRPPLIFHCGDASSSPPPPRFRRPCTSPSRVSLSRVSVYVSGVSVSGRLCLCEWGLREWVSLSL